MQFEEVQLIVIDQKKKKLNLLLHALKFLKYFNLFESEKNKEFKFVYLVGKFCGSQK